MMGLMPDMESPAAKEAKAARGYAERAWMEIADRLKEAREAAGLSLWQVEALSSSDHDKLKAFEESSVCYMSLEDVLQLVRLYGVSLAWVMTGNNPAYDGLEVARMHDAGLSKEERAKLLRLFEMTAGAER